MLRRIFLILTVICLYCTPLFAQVVTPSLDPSKPLVLPSAASWRIAPVIGVSQTQLVDQQTETLLDHELNLEYKIDVQKAVLSVPLGDLTLEVDTAKTKFSITAEYDNPNVASDLLNFSETYEFTSNRGMLSYRFGERFSLGVLSHNQKGETSDNDAKSQILSASFRVNDNFFIAYGNETVETANLDWSEQFMGFSFYEVAGFHVEYSKQTSPEITSGNIVKGKWEVDRLVAEVQVSGLLLMANRTQNKDTFENETTEQIHDTAGLGYVPEQGLTLSLEYNRYYDDDTMEYTGLTAGVAYVF